MIIAIDGPSAAGKTTAANLLAQERGYLSLDTGSLYRAVGWSVLEQGIDPTVEEELTVLCRETQFQVVREREGFRILVDRVDVTQKLRTPLLSRVTSEVSTSPSVRQCVNGLIVSIAQSVKNGIILEGRDIGTAVFPDADIKFYLDAAPSVRGMRRFQELKAMGVEATREETTREIMARDQRDQNRSVAPLVRAADAVLIDSTTLTEKEVVNRMKEEIERREGKRAIAKNLRL